jgi:hypothetical protein
MQTKIFNAYRITHENGSIEDINALDLVQALENMEIPETESPVIQTFLIKKGIRTLIEDDPTEILFNAVVAENGGGSIATPATGRIHVGDMVQLKAIPARNYEFVSWTLNGKEISKEATINLVMPELVSGADTAVFTATFHLADISWTTSVEPAEASTAGCIAFPTAGISEANTESEFLAVPKEGFIFSHWEVNGTSVSENELLQTTVTPLAEGETARIYKAVFTTE